MKHIFDRMVSGEMGTSEESSELAESSPQPTELQPTETEAAEDSAVTPSDVKELTQELLKYGYLEEERKPGLFQRAMVLEKEITAALEPLDLVLRLDTHRGVAYLAVAETMYGLSDGGGSEEDGAWTHPLVRRQRLTLEQSLLIAILRQAFVLHEQEAGIGHGAAMISLDELLPQFLTYFEDSGSDAKNESRLASLLDQLKTYGIVSEIDKNQEVTIRPLIAHLANPDSLKALLQVLREQAGPSASVETAGASAETDN